MKKSLFTVLAVIALLWSCQKADETVPVSQETKTVAVRLDPQLFEQTRALGTELETGAKYSPPTKLWIYISSGDGSVTRIIPVATEELAENGDQPGLTIGALMSATGYEIKNVSGGSTLIQIIANPKSGSLTDAVLKSTNTAPLVRALSTDIQYESDPSLVTLYGEAPIVRITAGLFGATLELKPLVSRFQIKLAYDATTMADVVFYGVYVRNFYETISFANVGGTLNAAGSSTAPASANAAYYIDTYYPGMFDTKPYVDGNPVAYTTEEMTGKVFGYQFFPVATPLVSPEIVVKYYGRTIANGLFNVRYERVVSYQDAEGNLFNNWQVGKLYNFTITVGRGTENPVGEKVGLQAIITVQDWTSTNLLPVYQ